MNVHNKTIIVTGAGSGMGREMVLLLLQKGAKVAAIDLNEKTLHETAQLAGYTEKKLSTHIINVKDKQSIESLAQEIIQIHSQIDGLINNAGIIQPFVKINDLDYYDIERVMNINFYGLVYMTKTFLPHLLKRPEAHIVNISSMGGFLPVPGQTIYGASKAAVKLFTEGLRSELLDTKIKVTIVFPGAINTNIAANSGLSSMSNSNKDQQSFKTLSAKKAAEIIINGMESNAYRILVGTDAKFMDFIYRLNPKFAAEFIYKKMKSLLK